MALRRAKISDVAGLHLRETVRARVIAFLAGASRVTFNRFDLDEGRHKSAQYAAIADELIGDVAPVAPFQLREFAARRGNRQSGDVVLAPGSGVAEAHKRWAPTHYGELIRLLHSRDGSTSFTLLGAPSERPLLESIAALVRDSGATIQIVAPSSLRDSLAVLSEARVVVGGCSGSLHIAALVDAPIIGVYGPTNPGWTAPTASVVRIVRRGHLCSPCYAMDFISGCGNADCMDIAAVDVAAALDDIEHGTGGATLQWFPLSRLRVARPARRVSGGNHAPQR
jgi:ADP-heptose:LPS heptosyltransferase